MGKRRWFDSDAGTESRRAAEPTMDDVKRAVEEYSKIGQQEAKAGITPGLHNEGFEVSTVNGRRTYDILLELFDPKLIKFQFQVSEIQHGYDAAEYFTKYPGRFISMHVQGWSTKTKKMAAVGQDSLDWKKIFTAAKTGGPQGLIIYNTDCNTLKYYDGSNWIPIYSTHSLIPGVINGTTTLCQSNSYCLYNYYRQCNQLHLVSDSSSGHYFRYRCNRNCNLGFNLYRHSNS